MIGKSRVVGIAGGEEKCRWLHEELDLDGVSDYKEGGETEKERRVHLRAQIQALWPKGVDVYFDNVDGWQLEEALDSIAEGAPVVICGGISSYNNGARLASGPRNYLDTLLFRSARMEGFVTGEPGCVVAEEIDAYDDWRIILIFSGPPEPGDEVDVHGGNATADDFMDAFGF